MSADEAFLTILPECKSGFYPTPDPDHGPLTVGVPAASIASTAPTEAPTGPLVSVADIVTVAVTATALLAFIMLLGAWFLDIKAW
jgi:hypothetical protein